MSIKAQMIDVPLALEAQAAFERATELDPTWSEAWLELAITSIWNANHEVAERAITRTLEIDGKNPDAWYLLYHLRAESGNLEAALEALEHAQSLAPDRAAPTFELDRVRAHSKARSRRAAKYPPKVSDLANFMQSVEQYLVPECGDAPAFLSLSSSMVTLGSCFARNIAVALRRLGLNAEHIESAEDLNTTYANRWFLEWLLREPSKRDQVFDMVLGRDHGDWLLECMKKADAFAFSLGVAPCFFDRATCTPVLTLGMNLHFALQSASLEFRTTSVEENVENLSIIADKLARINPRATLVLTVSPVPLRRTMEHHSAIVADCISKSTLRVAAEQFVRGRAGVVYFPSFEAVRWLAPYAGSAFGAEDGSTLHVNQDVIDAIMLAFIRRFGDTRLAAEAAVKMGKTN